MTVSKKKKGVKENKNKKAFPGLSSLSKKNVKPKKIKPALDEAAKKRIHEKRIKVNATKSSRWQEVIQEVAKRGNLSELHKELMQNFILAKYIQKVPRKSKKSFLNFVVLTFKIEPNREKDIEKLFGILKTAEGSVSVEKQKQESKQKRILKDKMRKQRRPAKKEASVKANIVDDDVEMKMA